VLRQQLHKQRIAKSAAVSNVQAAASGSMHASGRRHSSSNSIGQHVWQGEAERVRSICCKGLLHVQQ
jgi:hypothetical protein